MTLLILDPNQRYERRTRERRLAMLRCLARGESVKQAAATMGMSYSWARDNARQLCRLNGDINITGVVARFVLYDLQNLSTWTQHESSGGRTSTASCAESSPRRRPTACK